MASEEIWKPVVGFEGLYEVSNKGRVKGTRRRGCREKVLEGHPDRKGYKILGLYKNGKHKNSRMHRLVATAFIPNPEGKPQVNHIDSNRGNNNVDNLEWVTAKENAQHAYNSGSRTVTEKMVNHCREMGKKHGRENIQTVNGLNQRKVAMIKDGKEIRRFNSLTEGAKFVGKDDPSGVWACCNNKLPTYKGYVWRYIES